MMATALESQPEIDFRLLEKSLRKPRTFFSAALSVITGLMSLAAIVPLFSVLFMLLVRGGESLSIGLFTELQPAANVEGGGLGNALVGTLIVVAIASAIAVPFGILAAIYLAEFAPHSQVSTAVRFCAKVLTGLPSILAGVFAYSLVVLTTGTFSAPAGGVALALLMLPTVLLTSEEAIRMVPARMREAAIGMGATRAQTVLWVVLPTAIPGVLTGVMLAVARACGETAPLLFTALYCDYWTVKLMEPNASLAVLIYNFSGSPYARQKQIAWSASLVVMLFVLALNLGSQALIRRQVRK